MRLLLFVPIAAVSLVACTGDGGPSDDTATTSTGTTKTGDTETDTDIDTDADTDADSDTDSDTDVDTGPSNGTMGISGNVKLRLYTEDTDGDVQYIDWEDCYDGYPFGQVFVGAYEEVPSSGDRIWHATTNFSSPDLDHGDDYAFDVTAIEGTELHVFAAVDSTIVDTIIATYEPSGVWPDAIPVVNGSSVSDVDLTILVPADCGSGGGGGDDTGGGTTDYTTIQGELSVTDPWLDGDVVALLYTTDGQGPYESHRLTPTGTADGAEGDYLISVTMSSGEMSLLGAWDSNLNGIIDPADTWGSYVDGGVDGNPIVVGASDLVGHDITVPFGDVTPSFVPYVILSGTVNSLDDVTTYPASAMIYVAALKYRPDLEFSVSDLGTEAYDYASFPVSDFVGGSLPYLLVTPSNTIAFLWAYVDLDGDGVVQEVSEPVGAYGGSNGRMATGRASQSDLLIEVAAP